MTTTETTAAATEPMNPGIADVAWKLAQDASYVGIELTKAEAHVLFLSLEAWSERLGQEPTLPNFALKAMLDGTREEFILRVWNSSEHAGDRDSWSVKPGAPAYSFNDGAEGMHARYLLMVRPDIVRVFRILSAVVFEGDLHACFVEREVRAQMDAAADEHASCGRPMPTVEETRAWAEDDWARHGYQAAMRTAVIQTRFLRDVI